MYILRNKFRSNSAWAGVHDITAIEYLLRQGKKALEMYSSPECKDIRMLYTKEDIDRGNLNIDEQKDAS